MISPWWSVGLTLLGGLGWLLVTCERRRAGFLVGLVAQVAWATYAVVTAQWGFLGSVALFGGINTLGLYRLWRARRPARVSACPIDGKACGCELAASCLDTRARVERQWHEANPGCTCRWSPLDGHETLCPAWTPPAGKPTGLFDPDGQR